MRQTRKRASSPSERDIFNERPAKVAKDSVEEGPKEDVPEAKCSDSEAETHAAVGSVLDIEKLARVAGHSTFGGEHVSLSTVDFRSAFEPGTAIRLRAIEVLGGTISIVNLAMASPGDFVNGSPHIQLKSDMQPATFALVGMAIRSALLGGVNSRQLSVVFSGRTWPRALAVLGNIMGVQSLWFPTFQGGTTLSTYRKKKDGDTNASPGRRRGVAPPSPVKRAPKTTRFIETPVKQWDEDILVFDGREPFSLPAYRELPVLRTEINDSSAVMVMFTAGGYNHKTEGAAVSLNILSVILLANPSTEGIVEPENIDAPIGVTEDLEADEIDGVEDTGPDKAEESVVLI